MAAGAVQFVVAIICMACIKTFGLQSENRFQMRQKARGRKVQPVGLALQLEPVPYFSQKGKAFVTLKTREPVKLCLWV